MAFAVRRPLAGSPGLTRQIEQAVWSVNASLPVAAVRTMQDIYDRSLGRTSFTLVMLLAAAVAALVLGVVGLYGVLSYAVSTRRREIAIRFALGAQHAATCSGDRRQGVVLAGIGVAIGLVAAAGVTRLMASLLYEVQAVDPLTYAAVAAGLIAVAALASYLPARRASAVDPADRWRRSSGKQRWKASACSRIRRFADGPIAPSREALTRRTSVTAAAVEKPMLRNVRYAVVLARTPGSR